MEPAGMIGCRRHGFGALGADGVIQSAAPETLVLLDSSILPQTVKERT